MGQFLPDRLFWAREEAKDRVEPPEPARAADAH
jgi:hypothetical protein